MEGIGAAIGSGRGVVGLSLFVSVLLGNSIGDALATGDRADCRDFTEIECGLRNVAVWNDEEC